MVCSRSQTARGSVVSTGRTSREREAGPSDFSVLRFILFNKPWCQAYPALAGVGVAKVLAHGSLGKR